MGVDYNGKNENDSYHYGYSSGSYNADTGSYGTDQSYNRTQGSYGYNSQGSYQYQPDTGRYESEQPVQEMSVGRWFLTFLIGLIPVVNLVMLIIWAVGRNPRDRVRKNWARAQLIWVVIFTVLTTVALIVFGIAFASVFGDLTTDEVKDYWAEEAGNILDGNYDNDAVTLPDLSEDRPVVDATPIDGEWEDMIFEFDGQQYAMPFSYSELEANGWSINLADYGYEDGYVLNPRDYTYATYELTNPDYEDVEIYVGFINSDSTVKDIRDCEICAFDYDVEYAMEKQENYPLMRVVGGPVVGMDEDGVVSVMGKCEDVYDGAYYKSYSYSGRDYITYIDIDIYPDYGVTSIDLTYYP